MNRTFVAMLGSLLILGGLLGLMMFDSGSSAGGTIMFFCAASNRAVMEEIETEYEAETGRNVEIRYDASQTLLSSIEVSRSGDLYLPADAGYLTLAKEKGLSAEVIPVARQKGVIAVRKGNDKNIQTFADLLNPDIVLVQANPDATAIGKVTRRELKKQDLWEQLDKATTAYRGTVTEVANDLLVDAADVGIVYDAVLHTYPGLEFISIPELKGTESRIGITVIADSKQPAAALHFARYVAARDRGLKHYAAHGFTIEDGDHWEDRPDVSVFAGSMLRPAIDRTIKDFEKREGVRVTRVYNGCGILVAQMKAGQKPDAYFACDLEFMQQVKDLFPDPTNVSENELVILVQKGNPKKIASLEDLTANGLRVGVGHEKQCAMGWITQNVLKESGLQSEVMENVTVQVPTGDMLVNELRAGALDAAVVYLSNAAGSVEHVDAVRIKGLDCSIAIQPFAIAEQSRYRQITERLFERIISTESQDQFRAEGFRWKADEAQESLDRRR